MTQKDAEKLVDILEIDDVFDEIVPSLKKAFPQHNWHELVKKTCPKCKVRSRLVLDDYCLHCSSVD